MMNNEPTKTKKAMKTIKFLSMAALALVGAMMTGCSSDDNIIDTPQQPENTGNVVTLTTTVGLNEGAEARGTTRALGIDYVNKQAVKTFAAGETMAIVYKNKSGNTVKAVSAALTDGDITTTTDPATNKKSATFTFELTDPDKTKPVMYIYPAAMAKASIANDATIDEANTVDYTNLDAQNGTLGTLESSLDLATFSGNWNGTSLPTGTLTNQLAILAITLKNNAATPEEITSSITSMTLKAGDNTYTVSRSAVAGPIYVAIRPVTAALQYTATAGTKNYTKTATSREYAAGNFYNLGLRMAATGHALSTSEVGEIVCSDGLAYAAADKNNLPTGVTARAMIAYVGIETGVVSYTHGLALALSDEVQMAWQDAIDACSAKNTSTLVTGATWLLANKDQWNKMIDACKDVLGNNNNYQDLRDGFTRVGGTNLVSHYYWASTEYNTTQAWVFPFNNGSWNIAQKTNDAGPRVRACLAF